MKHARPRPRGWRELVLRVDSLAAGGDGVARAADGLVVFLPGTAPGDRVRARVRAHPDRNSAGKPPRFARAEVLELLEPGRARVDPVCSVYGDCGGCSWQHVAYEAQLAAKVRILADALERIGGVPCEHPPMLTPSPSPYGYRGRTRVVVQRGRVGYRRRRSHEICAVESCPVLVPVLDAKLAELVESPPAEGEWELAVGAEGVRAARVSRRRGPTLSLEVGPERIGFSPGVFAQSNTLMLEALVERVVQLATLSAGAGFLLELYAGAGLLTLPLSRRFERVEAVEGDANAASDLRENLRSAGLHNVEVRSGPVEAERLNALSPDVVVVDPPRAGLPQVVIDGLVGHAPRVVYLSCDPATLARDVKRLGEGGLQLRHVEAFDLFPQTPHVESLVLLEREAGRPG